MSIRYITDEQFSDGTTIDGNRLEEALQQLEQLSDNVPMSAIKTRFTQTQLVFGWSPVLDSGAGRPDPFLPIANVGAGTDDAVNIRRYKGTQTNAAAADLLGWEISTQFDHPVLVHALDYALLQDDATGAPYQLPGVSAPYQPPNAFEVEVHVYVDSEYAPSDRTQSDMEIHKHDFSTDTWRLTSTAISSTPATIMEPAYPGGNASGWVISLKDLNIPIRSLGRIRVVLLIPGATGKPTPWGSQPWRTFSPTLTATFLEPLRYG